jgi:hypothetical protein
MSELLPIPLLIAGVVVAAAWELVAVARTGGWRRAIPAAGLRTLSVGACAVAFLRPQTGAVAVEAAEGGRGVVIAGSGGVVPASLGLSGRRAPARLGHVALRGDTADVDAELGATLAALGPRPGCAFLVLGDGDDPDRAADLAARIAGRGHAVCAVAPLPDPAATMFLTAPTVIPPEPRTGTQAVVVSELRAALAHAARVKVDWTLDGESLGSRDVNVGAGATITRLERAFVVPGPGAHRLRLETTEPCVTSSGRFFRASPGVRRLILLEGDARPIYRYVRRALEDDAGFSVRAECSAERTVASAVIPRTSAEWSSVDLVVLGNLAAAEMPPGFAARLAVFVREGGGLLVLAGDGNLDRGGWNRTALSDVLPAASDEPGGVVAGPLDVRPAGSVGTPRPFPFGSLWAGPASPSAVDAGVSWRTLDELDDAWELPGLGASASVPIVATRPGRTVPLLAWHRAGAGACAIVTSEAIWRWAAPGGAQGVVHDQFWRDLAAGLARSSAPEGRAVWLEARASRIRAGDVLDVDVYVYVTDPAATVLVEVSADPGGGPADVQTVRLPAGALVRHFGMAPRDAGSIALRAVIEGADGPAGTSGCVVRVDRGEAVSGTRDVSRLRAACELSAGCLAAPEAPGEAVRRFLAALAPPHDTSMHPSAAIRRVPVAFLFAAVVAALLAEWLAWRSWERE